MAVLGMVFSPEIIIERWSTLDLVSSTTSKKKYPCPVDTYLQCLVRFSHPKSLLTGRLHLLWYAREPPKNGILA